MLQSRTSIKDCRCIDQNFGAGSNHAAGIYEIVYDVLIAVAIIT